MKPQQIKDLLLDMSNLKENWDSYGAKPIEKSLLQEVAFLIGEINHHDALSELYPLPNGDINVIWNTDLVRLEVQCKIYHKEYRYDYFFERYYGLDEDTEEGIDLSFSEIVSIGENEL